MNQKRSAATSTRALGESFKNGRARALGTAGWALMLSIATGGVATAQTAPAGVPDKSFPESVTSTKDGTLYAGSFNEGGVVKIAPGGKAEPFLTSGGTAAEPLSTTGKAEPYRTAARQSRRQFLFVGGSVSVARPCEIGARMSGWYVR